jgi:hypothetical protein
MKNRRPIADIIRSCEVDHTVLALHSLHHFHENTAVAGLLGRAVESSLRGSHRFPHTVLCGPADSGKRSLVHAISRELVQPVLELDMHAVRGSGDLHAVFKEAGDGAIVLLTHLEAAPPQALRDLQRAVGQRMRLDAPHPGMHHDTPAGKDWVAALSELEFGPRKSARALKPYDAFTVIATTRVPLDPSVNVVGWVERTYHLGRTAETEAFRLRRALARRALWLDEASVNAIAEAMVSFGIRTLAGVATLVEWMRAEGVTTMDASQRVEELVSIFAPMAHPAHAERQRKALECDRAPTEPIAHAAASPASSSPAPSSPAPSSASPTTPTQPESPHP